jgi:hypothetical protein
VTRHASLPGAAELFRPTVAPLFDSGATVAVETGNGHGPAHAAAHAAPAAPRRGSGRQKHDAKITVYVSEDELVGLEQARLLLRAHHGLSVDRGRIVREAIAVILADLDENGERSVLVQRLLDAG